MDEVGSTDLRLMTQQREEGLHQYRFMIRFIDYINNRI